MYAERMKSKDSKKVPHSQQQHPQQLKGGSTPPVGGRWVKKTWSIHTVGYGPVSERKAVPTPAAAWRNAEDSLRRSATEERDKQPQEQLCMVPLVRGP